MKNFKLVCCASLLATGVAEATVPCDGFEIKIKNQLADALLISQKQFDGAEISPGGIQKINAKTEQVFSVNKSTKDVPMIGEFTFHTMSVPLKTVTVKFDLKNGKMMCKHNDRTPTDGAYTVEKKRLPGKVEYTIVNK